MKKFNITKDFDTNYVAVVVSCPIPKEHPNANKLEIFTIFGCDVISAKNQYNEGDKLIYFPVECAIDSKFLSWMNLFEDSTMNRDNTIKSYFRPNGRVRAVNLRGIPSQGFLLPVSKLAEYYNIDETMFKVGDCFNAYGEDVLVTKYVAGKNSNTSNEPSNKSKRIPMWLNSTIGILPRPIRRVAYSTINSLYNREGITKRFINGSFEFHYKTPHFGKSVYSFSPTDEIVISEKLHGTSASYSNILCKKKFNPLRILFKSSPNKYEFVYNSRGIVKNRKDGKFTDDVWGIIAEDLKDRIPDGFSTYGEIVGSTPSGNAIQKGYTYGVPKGLCKFVVYRVVKITDGVRTELSWNEIEKFCSENGLETVPVHYQGIASNHFPDILIDEHWHDNFMERLKKVYLDKQCSFCVDNVVNEGIVIRNESKGGQAYKHKSPRFLIKESTERDNCETNIDEEN